MGKLRIYIDENVDISIAKGLERQGIEVFTAVDEGLIGKSDMEHFNHARKLSAVLDSIGEYIRRLSSYAEIVTPAEMKNQIEFL